MFSKTYTVILEYIKLSLFTDNVDWCNKQIKLSHNIEYIIVNIQHLQYCNTTQLLDTHNNNNTNNTINNNMLENLPLLSINSQAPSHQDIINYWYNLPDDIKNSIELITDLILNIDYFIAPLYITHDIIILGIIVYDNVMPTSKILKSNLYTQNYNIIDNFNFVSSIKPYNTNICKNKQYKINYNIINGILYHRVMYNNKPTFINTVYKDYNMCNIYNTIVKQKHNKDIQTDIHTDIPNTIIDKFNLLTLNDIIQYIPELQTHYIIHQHIKWNHILSNIKNYIPLLEVI